MPTFRSFNNRWTAFIDDEVCWVQQILSEVEKRAGKEIWTREEAHGFWYDLEREYQLLELEVVA